MFVMSVIITGNTTLRVLAVGWNVIGDDGISMISEELQHCNSLTKLSLSGCGISVKGEELIILYSLSILVSVNIVASVITYFHI